MDIAVIGGEEFTLGFRLAGITNVVDLPQEKDPAEGFAKLLADDSLAIILTDHATLDKLDERTRRDIEENVRPVIVMLSTQTSQEGLRKLIQKSIGVDLWKEG